MAYTESWKSSAKDRYGEAPHVRLSVRDRQGNVSVLTVAEQLAEMNPSTRELEKDGDPGVTQASSMEIRLTNETFAAMSDDLIGGWALVEIGFPVADEWRPDFLGQIDESDASTDGTIRLQLVDVIFDLLQQELERDIYFRETAWVSDIKDQARDEDSSGYDMAADGAGVEIYNDENLVRDETLVIEFTSSTAFKVICGNGDDTQTGTISADCEVAPLNAPAQECLRIHMEGWDQESGAYTAGDQFVFHTSRVRLISELGAFSLIRWLIEEYIGLQVYDFDTDAMVTAVHDDATWDALETATSGNVYRGQFDKGESIMDLIQGVLRREVGFMYPTHDGKIAARVLEPIEEVPVGINGDPGQGPVSIISASRKSSIANSVNEVTFNYRVIGTGDDASVTLTDEATTYANKRPRTMDIGWEISPLLAIEGCSRTLNRLKNPMVNYILRTTFDGAAVDLGQLVEINEPDLDLRNLQVGVVAVTADPLPDQAAITARNEEIVLEDYGQVMTAEGLPGFVTTTVEGDTNNAKVW